MHAELNQKLSVSVAAASKIIQTCTSYIVQRVVKFYLLIFLKMDSFKGKYTRTSAEKYEEFLKVCFIDFLR